MQGRGVQLHAGVGRDVEYPHGGCVQPAVPHIPEKSQDEDAVLVFVENLAALVVLHGVQPVTVSVVPANLAGDLAKETVLELVRLRQGHQAFLAGDVMLEFRPLHAVEELTHLRQMDGGVKGPIAGELGVFHMEYVQFGIRQPQLFQHD